MSLLGLPRGCESPAELNRVKSAMTSPKFALNFLHHTDIQLRLDAMHFLGRVRVMLACKRYFSKKWLFCWTLSFHFITYARVTVLKLWGSLIVQVIEQTIKVV